MKSLQCVLGFLGLGIANGVITTLADALQRQVFLQKLDTFVYDHFAWGHADSKTTCTNTSNHYSSSCGNITQDSQCKVLSCGNPSYTTQSACTSGGSTWTTENDAPNSLCCTDGEAKCDGCCNNCISGGIPAYSGECDFAGFEGPSVCGTTNGTCGECIGSSPRMDPTEDQSTCTNNHGTCSIDTITSQTQCVSSGGTWTPAYWHWYTNYSLKALCTSMDYCGHCNISGQDSITSCYNQGGTWLKDYNIDESTCDGMSGYKWVRVRKFESGNELPAPPMKASSCSTGPDHTMDIDHCYDPQQYLADAANFSTFQEAYNNYSSFYRDVWQRWRNVARAVVTNHANATDRAAFGFKGGCLVGVLEPKNKGRITATGNGQTFVIIYRPTNYADADSITVRNASVMVLGGTSGGPIDLADAPKVEVSDVNNTGDIVVARSQDIFISKVRNLGNAKITVTDVTATLNHVTNEGQVLVRQGGTYRAYNIINTGTVTIEAGSVIISTICPSSGTMNIHAGVIGNIAYESGCMGTIILDGVDITNALKTGGSFSNPSAIKFAEVVKKGKVLQGSLGMTVPDADAFINDAVALNAVAEGIAEKIQAETSWVTCTATKTRRLSPEESEGRFLAGNSVSVAYTVNIPESASSAIAGTTEQLLKDATVAELSTAVSSKVQAAKGYTVSISSKSAVLIEDATTTSLTTTMDSGGSATTSSGSAATSAGSTSSSDTVVLGLAHLLFFVFALTQAMVQH